MPDPIRQASPRAGKSPQRQGKATAALPGTGKKAQRGKLEDRVRKLEKEIMQLEEEQALQHGTGQPGFRTMTRKKERN